LQQVQLPALDRPLDILRRSDVRLDAPSQSGNFDGLPRVDSGFDRAAARRRAVTHRPLVADGVARDDSLAQAAPGGDHHLVASSAHRIGGESDAGRFGHEHALYQYGQPSAGLPAACGQVVLDAHVRCRRANVSDGLQ
jgi:hypothetical protein